MGKKILQICLSLVAIALTPAFAAAPPAVTEVQTVNPELAASAEASANWVKVIDQGNYDQAWDQGALTLKLRIPKKDWKTILEVTRKPFGSVKSREIADQRTAQDPAGLPKGNYMVVVYNTSFNNGKTTNELVTLVQETDGKWRGLTYMIK